jgi:DNA polymerase-1
LKKTIALVDADAACYTAVASAGQELDFGDGDPVFDWEACKRHVQLDINFWTKRLDLDDVLMCWSDEDRQSNFRLDVLPTYKANRDGTKPEGYWELREYMSNMYESVTLNRLEGDDVAGIMQTGPFGRRHNTIIIGVDKDFCTIPGRWYQPGYAGPTGKKYGDELRTITPDQAHWFHMYQTLVGDSVDNYTGCPLVGHKKAMEALGGPGGNLWSHVVACYEDHCWTEEDAVVQAMVARILHRSDWDADTQEVKLWTPHSDAS